MQLISLTAPIRVWPPKAGHPVEAHALVGELDRQEETLRVEVHALVPPCGGLLTFRVPVAVVLSRDAVASTQQVEPLTTKEG